MHLLCSHYIIFASPLQTFSCSQPFYCTTNAIAWGPNDLSCKEVHPVSVYCEHSEQDTMESHILFMLRFKVVKCSFKQTILGSYSNDIGKQVEFNKFIKFFRKGLFCPPPPLHLGRRGSCLIASLHVYEVA